VEIIGKDLTISVHNLVGQQHLKSYSKSGSSGRPQWSTRNKRKIWSVECLSGRRMQFQTKGGINDGILRVFFFKFFYPGCPHPLPPPPALDGEVLDKNKTKIKQNQWDGTT